MHTQAIIDALHGRHFPADDEGALAYFLRGYFTDDADEEAVAWTAENVPAWVIMGRVNWAEVAREVQTVAA